MKLGNERIRNLPVQEKKWILLKMLSYLLIILHCWIDINSSFSIYLSRKQLNMSGRGKGGKGLGKGGAKRHRKALRDNIQGVN